MSKNIFVECEGRRAKVKCNDFNSFKSGVERKLRVSLSNHRLEYRSNARNEWIGIYADDDLEDITEQTQVRVIQESRDENRSGGSGEVSIAAHGNQNVHQVGYHNEDKKITAEKIAGRDYIGGDQITTSNMSNVYEFNGTMRLRGLIFNPVDLYFPDVDMKDFDITRLIKKAKKVRAGTSLEKSGNPEVYDIQHGGKSQALIFNIIFANTELDRGSARRDTPNLKELLVFLGFQVTVQENYQTKQEIMLKIDKFLKSKKVADAPMVLLFIGSHGKQIDKIDHFLDENQELVQVRKIVDQFVKTDHYSTLKGKPKIFLFQFCRDSSDGAVESDSYEKSFLEWYNSQVVSADAVTENSSELDDMLLAYATLPECKAYREKPGSWFVLSICLAFIPNAYQDHLIKLFEKANEKLQVMRKEAEIKHSKNFIQTCTLRSSLKKRLYFYLE